MEHKKESSFGISRILGVQLGESKDISKCKEMLICVELLNVMLIL
jgi:hypothetical protein